MIRELNYKLAFHLSWLKNIGWNIIYYDEKLIINKNAHLIISIHVKEFKNISIIAEGPSGTYSYEKISLQELVHIYESLKCYYALQLINSNIQKYGNNDKEKGSE